MFMIKEHGKAPRTDDIPNSVYGKLWTMAEPLVLIAWKYKITLTGK